MNKNSSNTIGVDTIRQTVFEMESPFTVGEVVEKIKTSQGQDIDSMLVIAYLDQISNVGIVEQHGRKYWKNIPDFNV